jgi:5-methyltetrahydropteroyltriglutamate--homocysteine methyltransferase
VTKLRQHARGRFKVTLPAPSNFYVVSWKPGVSDWAYDSREELLRDLVAILRGEVEALIAEGVTYVQLDAPFYCVLLDDAGRAGLRQAGLDPERAAREMAAADSACVEGLAREGLTLALHVCRGNSRSRWLAEGAFDPIAEPLLGTTAFDVFLLEYDSARDGGFEPLRFLSPGKTAVLGLVTTKEPRLESRDELARLLDLAAAHAPLDQLALSPQCGFASVAAGNLLSEEDQWRKLELVVETARAVWT